jgi:hypothetical protein
MIDLVCTGCGGGLRVADDSAGRRIRCPQCHDIVYVPVEGRASEPQELTWRMRLPNGDQYGPVSRSELDAWVAEGRVTGACQLLCEGSNRWRWAGEIYPELGTHRQTPASVATAFTAGPAAGYHAPSTVTSRPAISDKSRTAAAVLGFFLGPLGVHRFYLGYPRIGLLMLFTLGGLYVVSFIDSILILCGVVPDGEGRPLDD